MLVFGAINVDFVFPVAKPAAAGDTVWSDRGHVAVGGQGANQAIAAVRDGAHVAVAGAVGRDSLAEFALAELRREGVVVSGLEHTAAALTGRSAMSVTPDGRTSVTTSRGANAHARAAMVGDSTLAGARTLLVQLDTDPTEVASLIMRARALGVRVILNVSPTRPIDADALRAADLLIGNAEEISWLGQALGTGNNAASVQQALGVTTVRMMGVQGVEVAWEGAWRHMPAYSVEMRDTSAAADCFCGVLAAALDHNTTLKIAVRRAAVAAALSVTEVGAGSTAPRSVEIDRALRSAPQVTGEQNEVPD